MEVLILDGFLRLKRDGFNKVWETLEQDGVFWLQLGAEQDLIDGGIKYTKGIIQIEDEEIL
jgi:hypothetical protein